MDIQTIGDFINNNGFPIACCCALFWMNNKNNIRNQEGLSKITTALNNNTLALQKLVDKLSNKEES